MNRIHLSFISILTLLAAPAGAEETAGADPDVIVLDTLTVTTPLRRESPLARSTSSVTVIEAGDIARSPATDLISLLHTVAGISISQTGGDGARTGISIRGAKAQQTLILINGVSIKSPTSGEASTFNIPLEAIERIEIAKGAHSAQYGSDAIGGVINIITKTGAGTCGKDICTTVSGGIDHPWGGFASVRTGGVAPDGSTFSVGGLLTGTRGFDFTTPDNPDHEPDDDGFLQGAVDFAYERETGWGAVHASGLYARSRAQYDMAPIQWWDGQPSVNEVDNDLFSGKAGIRLDHAEGWESRLDFSAMIDRQDNFRKGTAARELYDVRRYGVSASTQKRFDTGRVRNSFAFGAEAFRELVDSTIAFEVTSRDLAASWLQYSLEVGALSIDAGLRYDHNSQFGSVTTYNIGASYEIADGLTARASHGTGFRAPTFNDLYWPGFSNPDLQPETSQTEEAGLRWQPFAGTFVDIALYQTRLRNFFDPQPGGGIVNVDAARIRGVEISLAHHFNERWWAGASLEFREPKDLTTGEDLLRRERFKASLELGYRPVEKLRLGARLLHGGRRMDTDPATFADVSVPSYTTLDFTAMYDFDDRSRLKLSVENLLDADYTTAKGWRAPGRSIHVSYSRTF